MIGRCSRLIAGLVLGTLSAALVGGCPCLHDTPRVSGVTLVTDRTYWVETHDGELAAFALPEVRGEAGAWSTLGVTAADWYTGPGLYELDNTGTWSRVSTDDSLTLDAVLQTYDPPPAAPQ